MLQDHTFSIWLCASFYESHRIFDELSARFNELHYLIHDVWAVYRGEKHSNISCDQAHPVLTLT